MPKQLGSDSILRYRNGLYQGNIQNSSPNGLGIFYFDTGELYYGEWKDGKMEVSINPLNPKILLI
jgi:hypothetical protein